MDVASRSYLWVPLLVLAPAACAEVPTATSATDAALTVPGLEASVVSAQSANLDSNGQLFVTSPLAGFGVVNFPEACFVFDLTFGEPDSWFRATQEDIVTMEHHVVQDGVLLVGSFFTGLKEGTGHGTLSAHYRRDGSFNGVTISANGRLLDGSSVNCKLVVDAKGEVRQSFIRVGSPAAG